MSLAFNFGNLEVVVVGVEFTFSLAVLVQSPTLAFPGYFGPALHFT